MLIDKNTMTSIIKVTCEILYRNFFYDESCLKRFLDLLFNQIQTEYCFLEDWIDDGLRIELKYDHLARMYFTSYFVSENMRDIMLYDLHFTESELEAFDNILPKYSGASDNVDIESRNKRARY